MGNRFTKDPLYPRGTPKLVINMRLDEKAALAAKAKALGCTISDLVRLVLRTAGMFGNPT